jgi:glycosyltransferase involved in cell wall biosynthesis
VTHSVLIYTPTYFPEYVGGGERLAQLTAEGLRELGVEVAVLTASAGARRFQLDGVDVLGVPHQVRGPHWTQREPDAAALTAILRAREPSIVHAVSMAGLEALTRAVGARPKLGVAAMEYGMVCTRRTLVRGSGALCGGRESTADCFACQFEDKRKRDRLLAQAGRMTPASISGRVTAAASRLARRPIGLHLQAWDAFQERERARQAVLERLALLVVPTAYTRSMLEPHLRPGTRCGTLMYPSSQALRSPEPKQADDAVLRVGFVGRALPIKGIDVLIDAVEALRDRVPIQLHVHCPRNDGEAADYSRPLEGRVTRLPGSTWTWCGVLDEAGLRKVHRTIDVLVVPSIWPEFLGFVALEAQGLGTPLVLSDLASQRELADGDGRSSWFVRPGDATALAACLEQVWQRKREGTLAPPRSVAPSSAEYAAQLLRLYDDAGPR